MKKIKGRGTLHGVQIRPFPLGKDVVNKQQLRCKAMPNGAMPNGPIRAEQVNRSSTVIG